MVAGAAAFSLLSPWCFVHAVDDGIGVNDAQSLVFWLVAGVLSLALSGGLRFAGKCRISKAAVDVEKQRLCSLFSKTFHANLLDLPAVSRGEVMGQLLFASAAERQFIEMIYGDGVSILLLGAGTFVALLSLSWPMALISFALCPVFALILVVIKRKLRPATRDEYEAHENLYRKLVECFRAIVVIRTAHAENRFEEAIVTCSTRCADTGYKLEKTLAVQGPIFDILQAVVIGAIFGVGGYFVMNSAISIGVLIGFQLYLTKLFGVMKSGSGIFGAWQQFIEGKKRAAQIENLAEMTEFHHEMVQDPFVLQLKDVSFSFGERKIWDKTCLDLKKGEKKALLLPSGSGKTTLARCILGVYPIEEGDICIPDGDVQKIGFVPQENVIFDGSIRDNISLMNASLSDEKYRDVLYMSGLESVASRFGDESVGESGSRLSGGEQRRLMLAEALAREPKVLIIDQMASELEPELCRVIFARIHEKLPDLGILYLGHRAPEW